MIVWLIAIGFVSVLGQVVLLRELNVAFFGTELIYILAIGVWLAWTAIGAAIGRRGFIPPGSWVPWLLVALACVLPLSAGAIRALRIAFGGVPGAYLPFGRQLLAMALVLLPVCLALGLLFQWAARLYVGERRTLAAAYAIESAGGVAGGILATLFLVWGMRNLTAGLVCALFALAAAVWPWRQRGPRWFVALVGAVAALLIAALAWSPSVDRRMTSWNHPKLAATGDTPYGRVSVTEVSGQVSVFLNDALVFDTEGTDAEEFAHLAALQHPAPRRVLLLGGGIEGLVRELVRHEPDRLDYVEIDDRMISVVLPFLPDEIRGSLEHEAVRVITIDPRAFLAGDERYDLILVSMPEPASGQANRYYTREFFGRCERRLETGGVLALRLPGAENLWTPWLTRRTASIDRALRGVFEDVVILPGTTNFVLASDRALTRDPAELARRLEARAIEARLVGPAYLDYLYTNDRFFEIADLMAATDAPVNTDSRPLCYTYTLGIWLSRFFPDVAAIDLPDVSPRDAIRSTWVWLTTGLLGATFLVLGRRPMMRRSLLAAVAGFAGMVLESVLILHYQTVRGLLFQDLGLLLTSFMAGLTLGSGMVHSLARRRRGGLPRTLGIALLAGIVGLCLIVARLSSTTDAGGLVATSFLLLGCGFLVAAVFAHASLYRAPNQRGVVSPLYSADLVGGCVGSLAAGLVLIPLLGLPASALLIIFIILPALTLT
jgi:spermidine synthase